MIARYNVSISAWEIGYWVSNTRFRIVDIVKAL
jgi:hypothetical protein